VKDSLAQQLRSRKMARAHVFGSYDNGRLGDAAAAAAAAVDGDGCGSQVLTESVVSTGGWSPQKC
jgi:hypothetical protein